MTDVLDRVSFADQRVDEPGYSILLPARERLQSRVGPILGSWKEALCRVAVTRCGFAPPTQQNLNNQTVKIRI